jgi:O-succinylbenzoic acid--CoA ligase
VNITGHYGYGVSDWLYALRGSARLALETETRQWTWRELHEHAAQLAGALRERGVCEGDRVALFARDGGVFCCALHAVRYAGAVIVPVNTRLTAAEVGEQLQRVEPRLLLADQAHESLAHESLAHASLAATHLNAAVLPLAEDVQIACQRPHWRETVTLDGIQSIVFTSGTTGRPKGAQITFGSHLAQAAASALRLGLAEQERWLTPLPLFHVGGQSVLMRSVIAGTCAVVRRSFDPDRIAADVRAGATLLSVVPTMLADLLDAGALLEARTLRAVLLGGAGAPQTLLERAAASGLRVCTSYGLTESNSQAATLAPDEAMTHLGAAGRPLAFTDLRIERDGGAAPPGVAGEIELRGPAVFSGYWKDPEATRRAFAADGYFRTGDVGYVDDEGFLHVLDRRSDLIVSGGENVYPAEVESVLCAHEAVHSAGVVGAAHERYGQVPVAVVVLRSGAVVSEEQLTAFCKTRLAGYKVPRRVIFADHLPRGASGKLQRRELRAWL